MKVVLYYSFLLVRVRSLNSKCMGESHVLGSVKALDASFVMSVIFGFNRREVNGFKHFLPLLIYHWLVRS